MSLSSIIFSIAAIMMLAGIVFVAVAAMLFKESNTGQTQDTYGLDTPADNGHWSLLWVGAVLFGFGVMLCFVGAIAYLMEKL